MPGFYVSPQSPGIGSGLASAIAQIANNYNPETIARAANLAQNTQNLQWANRKASTEVPAYEQLVQASGEFPGATGGEIAGGNRSFSHGGNPYVPPQQGQPETARSVVDTSGYGIIGRMSAGRAAAGAGVDELLKLNNYGQQVNRGPGQDIGTQADIYKTSMAPFDLQPGIPHVIPMFAGPYTPSWQKPQAQAPATPAPVTAPAAPVPAPAATPPASAGGGGATPASVSPAAQPGAPTVTATGGTGVTAPATPAPAAATPAPVDISETARQTSPGVWQGGSLWGKTSQEEGAKSSMARNDADIQHAIDAGPVLAQLNATLALYKKVLQDNNSGFTGRLSNEAQMYLTKVWHIPAGDKPQAIQEIEARMLPLISQLRGTIGFQRFTGGEFNKLSAAVASGMMPPEQFYDFIGASEAALIQQQQYGKLALDYKTAPSAEKANAIDHAKMVISQQDPFAEFRAHNPSLFPPDDTPLQPTKPAPAVGTIEPGPGGTRARYNGGPQNDPASWTIVP